MNNRILTIIASVGLVSALSCGASKVKVDDTAGAEEIAEIATDDIADANGALETVETQDAATDAVGSGDTGAEDETDEPGFCQPDCSGKECGDDGCGGSCGQCGIDGICVEHLCSGLKVAGTYSMTSKFAMANAIPGEAGQLIDMVVGLFTNPGPAIIDLVKDQAATKIGEAVADPAFGLFEDMLADIVTDWLQNQSPDWMQDFFIAAQDLPQIVETVELSSELQLSVAGEEGSYLLQGVQEWQLVSLYWKSGVYQFAPQQLAETAVPITMTSSQLTGMVANFDQLIIDTHTIDLGQGELALLIINEILLPAVSPHNDIEELLHSVIDCQAVADAFAMDVLDANGLTTDDVKSFCNGAVDFMLGPVEAQMGGLLAESNLEVLGKCDLADDNGDLTVDRLEKGLWFGEVQTNGQGGAEIDGTFEALRVE